MFKRKIVEELRKWADNEYRKPLILRGARQVGKTTVIKIFSGDFDNFLHFNLEDRNDRSVFENKPSFEKVVEHMFFYAGVPRDKGKTLVFIDEIQNSPETVSLLRYFYEKAPGLYVVAAGSLLENVLSSKISFPVGRVEFLMMHPVTFEEFLIAMDEKLVLDYYYSDSVPDYAHTELLKLFKTYVTIGGMPEIVKNFIANRDIVKLRRIYASLITTYVEDVEKYSGGAATTKYVQYVMKHAFKEAGNRITFENFGNSPYRSREIREAFNMLEKTMLFNLTYPVTSVVLPLSPDYKKKPRLQVFDTGLVNYSLNIFSEFIAKEFLSDVYRGKIAEHITGQEIAGASYEVDDQLYFWVRDKRGSTAEVDYVVQLGEKLIPVEVKSGATGRLRSLMRFVDESPHQWAVRLYSGKISVEDAVTLNGKKFKLINLPYYLAGRLIPVLARIILGN
jgi:predicted AAA+ superfamily ATPase